MTRDPYEVLGVSMDATAEEITAAYRKLAQQKHPDKRLNDPAEVVTREFQELLEAYTTLSDYTKRARYDDTGAAEETKETELRHAAIATCTDMLNMFIEKANANDADYMKAMRLQVNHVRDAKHEEIEAARAKIRQRQAMIRKWRKKDGGRNIFANALRRQVRALNDNIAGCKKAIELAGECHKVLDEYEYGQASIASTFASLK